MELDHDKLDEIINRLKQNGDVSNYKKDRKVSGFVNLLSQLLNLPKAKVPTFDFSRVKNQILDRIAAPVMEQESSWFLSPLSRVLRIGTVIVGSVLIIVSLTLGVAVAALNSAPGQTIYPLKKIVENIQLKLAPDDQKSSLQIQFANNRADELNLVLQQQQDGQISAQTAQKIVAATVKDLQKSASAAAHTQQPKAVVAAKLTDLSNKLKIASIRSEGQVKIELEQAIKDIEQAGLNTDNSVSAQGKLTAVTDTYVSIGSAKFLLNKDTKYVNVKLADLAIDQQVDIEGQIKDNKTFAQTITLISDNKSSGTDTKTEAPTTETPPASQ
jgi:hypothetical protein